jgi:hypothetical protein
VNSRVFSVLGQQPPGLFRGKNKTCSLRLNLSASFAPETIGAKVKIFGVTGAIIFNFVSVAPF